VIEGTEIGRVTHREWDVSEDPSAALDSTISTTGVLIVTDQRGGT
jgi:hypothetical protein